MFPPPVELNNQEKDAWEDTVKFIKFCMMTSAKVSVKIPIDLDGKWNKAQKLIWPLAKVELAKVEKRIAAVRRHAAMKTGKVSSRKEGHTEDPEALAAAGGKKRNTPSQPPFTANEKARLVHCIASPEFRYCVEIMLRGVIEREAIDDKLNRVNTFKELAILFNNEEMVFDNFFVGHEHEDEDLTSLDPNDFIERTESFLKGEQVPHSQLHKLVMNYICCFCLGQWTHEKASIMVMDRRYESSGRQGSHDEVPKKNFCGDNIGR